MADKAEREQAAQARKAAAGRTDDAWVAALKAERLGYVQRGLTDRVAEVDRALAAAGVKPEPKRRTAKG